MKKLFLIQLYSKNKLLFYFSILFIVFQLFFTYKGIETFPFLHYGMYSEKSTVVSAKHEIAFVVNNEPLNLNDYSSINQSFLHNNIAYFSSLKQTHFQDPISTVINNRFSVDSEMYGFAKKKLTNQDPQLFINWIKRYLSSKTNISINSLLIKRGDSIIIND